MIAGASLLVSVLALVLWPAGYWRRLAINYCFGRTQVGVVTQVGGIGLVKYVYNADVPGWRGGVFPADTDTESRLFDFGRMRVRQSGLHFDSVWCPIWFPIVLFGVMPAVWVVRFRTRRERSLRGRCRRCGYDLRATRDRCPECGTALAGAAQAAP